MQQPAENAPLDSVISEPSEQRTIPLADGTVQENVLPLVFGPDLLDELGGVAQSKRTFEAVIVDCRKSGFVFPAETMLDASMVAMKLLELHGNLVFVKNDKIVVVVKTSLLGDMMLHAFDAMADVFGFSPTLAYHILKAIGSVPEQGGSNSDLAEQILMSSVPVLTPFGIKLKVGMDSGKRRNLVLAAIDNYTPLDLILHRVGNRLNREEVLEELKDLENSRAISPIFAKIPFLVHCFRNQIPFKLLTYLVESRLITQSQLDEVLFLVQNTKGRERLSVGAQCVAKGFISARQLEIALQDQAFYGQHRESEKEKKAAEAQREHVVQSLVGHLGTTDPAGVLQTISNNRESGVLSVEHKDMQFRALFESGKVTHAKLGKLKGNDAVLEFASTWKEGVFVFLERQPPSDLVDADCRVTGVLDKLLLDAALAHDNIDLVWKKLPRGAETALEKLEDTQRLLDGSKMIDPQEMTALSEQDIATMKRLWKEFDGLVSINTIIKRLATITTVAASAAISRLLHYQLCKIPASDLHAPLRKFQEIAAEVAEKLGQERTQALLKLSLQSSAGYNVRARMFNIGSAGEIGVDLSVARQVGTSLSAVTRELEDWQVRFVEYVSQEIDKEVLRNIVYRVHQKS